MHTSIIFKLFFNVYNYYYLQKIYNIIYIF